MPAKDIKSNFQSPGTVRWIGLRPGRDAPMNVVQEVQADQQSGLVGDRFSGPPGSDRQVTLIQQEHLVAMGQLLDRDPIDPALTRRNIVVAGVNLLALKEREFAIGDAVLMATGNCAPCSKMEQNLGHGGFNAMRGHGGITARIVSGGTIRVGDRVEMVRESEPAKAASETTT